MWRPSIISSPPPSTRGVDDQYQSVQPPVPPMLKVPLNAPLSWLCFNISICLRVGISQSSWLRALLALSFATIFAVSLNVIVTSRRFVGIANICAPCPVSPAKTEPSAILVPTFISLFSFSIAGAAFLSAVDRILSTILGLLFSKTHAVMHSNALSRSFQSKLALLGFTL